MTFNIDVTEQVVARRRLEGQAAELEQARQAAEQAALAKDDFLRRLEHRLRDPLAPMQTALQVLALKGTETEETRILGRQVGELTRALGDLFEIAYHAPASAGARSRPDDDPASPPAAAPEAVRPAAGPDEPSGPPAPPRVLVVDDNEDGADTLRYLLEHMGYIVAVANDARAALVQASAFQPDVAILDIGLPVMDGYELAGHLQSTLGDRAPRLIALTGYGQQADRDRSAAAGFDCHLVKPLDFEALLRALQADGAAGPA
jgi:CheY-like chemotaxis protein